jgi:acetoin utilization protein AcuC
VTLWAGVGKIAGPPALKLRRVNRKQQKKALVVMKNGFIYTDAYLDYDYGLTHPLKIIRLKLAYELIQATGLLRLPSVQYIPTRKAEEEDLAFFHTRDYLSILKRASEGRFETGVYHYRFGPGGNPGFQGV